MQQYRQAVQSIIHGDCDAAKPLLLQLLEEPLLQPAAQAPAAVPASLGSRNKAQRLQQQQQQQQQQAVQPHVLQGMHFKVLLSLAPLLGQTQHALQVWAEALAYQPQDCKVWEEISIMLAQLGHLSLAVYAAERVLNC